MNSPLWLIPIFALLAGAVIYLRWRSRKPAWHRRPTDRAFSLIAGSPTVVTPNGHKVYYAKGVPQDMPLDEMDRGIEHTFRKLECVKDENGQSAYLVDRSRHDIKIVVLESEQAPESRTWCFRVPVLNGYDYYGTEWDMMRGQKGTYHYILAAEQVVAAGVPYGDVFIVPYVPSSEADKNYVARICEYSMEHIGYEWYDGPKYEATRYHVNGQGHPIIPECPDGVEL